MAWWAPLMPNAILPNAILPNAILMPNAIIVVVTLMARPAWALTTPVDTYASSSGVAKAVVGGLTQVINTLVPVEEREPRRRRFKSLSVDALVEGLRSDFFEKEYLWSGKLDAELYAEECEFSDPTLSFTGLATFERNLKSLDPIIEKVVPPENRRVSLVDIRKDTENRVVTAKWRMVGDFALPWRPRLELDGTTRFTYGSDGRIVSYDESWDNLSAVEALLTVLRPTFSGESPRRQPILLQEEKKKNPEHWPGRLEGVPPPTAVQTLRDVDVLIFPGFGNDQLDYRTPLGQPEDVGLEACLERRGATVRTLPIKRSDWIRVFTRGLRDGPFLLNQADWSSRAYDWYLDLAESAILAAERPLVVVGHSAGGWLVRALLRRRPDLAKNIAAVVTLGSPHAPPDGTPCATRGVLQALQDADIRLGPPPVPFLTVAGDAVDAADDFTLDSYSRVRGDGSRFLCGDGVVPLTAAHLAFADVALTLDGALHSINLPGTTLPTDKWYGAEPRVDDWIPALADLLRMTSL